MWVRHTGALAALVASVAVAEADASLRLDVRPPLACLTGASTELHAAGTTLELRGRGEAREKVSRVRLGGRGRCLAWVAALKTYAVGELNETPEASTLVSVRLLGEDGAVKKTAFERRGCTALAITPSASGRHLAFVGRCEGSDTVQLYDLDLVGSALTMLGEAPAPPPTESATATTTTRASWGPGGTTRFLDLERDVMAFDGETLQVSTGPDTVALRSSVRVKRTYTLTATKKTSGR